MTQNAKSAAIAMLPPRTEGPVKSVSESRMLKALEYLALSDMEYAKAKAYADGMSEQRKTIKAIQYLRSEGSQGDRTEKAYASPEYQSHLQKLENAILDLEHLKAKRQTESLIIDVWRSLNSARKQGAII